MAITKTVVGIYSSDGTTLTKLTESTTNLTSGLLDGTNTRYAQALNPATVILEPGNEYFVAVLVNASTGGTLQGFVKVANVVAPTALDQAPFMYTLATQTTLPTTQVISGLTESQDLVPYVVVLAA